MSATIKIGSKEIVLDDKLLKFNEHTINQFLQDFAAHYNTYQEAYADVQFLHSKYEDKFDSVYADKFRQHREESSSDKMAEMKTKCDPDVQEALENVRIAKRNVNMIWGYLRAMDRAHEDVINTGYNLRKELSTLYPSYIKKTDG